LPQSFQSSSYTHIQTGFTPSVQHRSHLLTGTSLCTDLSASYSELTGQSTPSQTIVLTTTEVSVSETVAPLVTGTVTTETVPSSVASIDPLTTGTLQAQVIETAALVATTSTALSSEPQGQAVAIAITSES
jgi:hypothetical protein